MDKNISTQLWEIKVKSGWSQPKLALAIRTSQPTVNRILNGQKDCMGETARAIIRLHLEMFSQADFDPAQPTNHDPTTK